MTINEKRQASPTPDAALPVTTGPPTASFGSRQAFNVWNGFLAFARSSIAGSVGLLIVTAFIVVATFAEFIAPKPPLEIYGDNVLEAPSSEFWFGTDGNGMDVFSRTLHAARLDLYISVSSVLISIIAGVVLGLVAGYLGGWFDLVLLRTMDVLQAFPVIILALAVVAATQQSLTSVILVIAFLDTPIYARMIRGQVLSLRESMYVESARAVGNPSWRVMWRHILPNTLPPVVIQTAVRLAWAVKVTSALAFVGVGIQVPTPEWGAMIRQGSAYIISGEWWPSVFPGLALMLLVLGFNLLADAIQDHLDPRND